MAQVIGEAAELDRLIQRADDAIASGDPQTASLVIGKAALMAAILAEQASSAGVGALYKGAEAHFRAQENAYRALALFDQAGGHPPAPSSTCDLLALAAHHQQQAFKHLAQPPLQHDEVHRSFYQQTLASAQEWNAILPQLHEDLACPEKSLPPSP